METIITWKAAELDKGLDDKIWTKVMNFDGLYHIVHFLELFDGLAAFVYNFKVILESEVI